MYWSTGNLEGWGEKGRGGGRERRKVDRVHTLMHTWRRGDRDEGYYLTAVGGRGEEEWGRYRPWDNNINHIS